MCVPVCVPCVVAPAPGQSAETAAAACGAGLSALLPPSWQMTSPGEASKLHGRTLNLLFLKFLHAVLLQDQLEYNTKTRSLYWYKTYLDLLVFNCPFGQQISVKTGGLSLQLLVLGFQLPQCVPGGLYIGQKVFSFTGHCLILEKGKTG